MRQEFVLFFYGGIGQNVEKLSFDDRYKDPAFAIPISKFRNCNGTIIFPANDDRDPITKRIISLSHLISGSILSPSFWKLQLTVMPVKLSLWLCKGAWTWPQFYRGQITRTPTNGGRNWNVSMHLYRQNRPQLPPQKIGTKNRHFLLKEATSLLKDDRCHEMLGRFGTENRQCLAIKFDIKSTISWICTDRA